MVNINVSAKGNIFYDNFSFSCFFHSTVLTTEIKKRKIHKNKRAIVGLDIIFSFFLRLAHVISRRKKKSKNNVEHTHIKANTLLLVVIKKIVLKNNGVLVFIQKEIFIWIYHTELM
jgi:hypothetical protein